MKFMLFLSFTYLFSMCKPYEPLSLQKGEIKSNNLEMNGYYYIFKDKEEGRKLNEVKYNTFFLYKNGVYFDSNGLSSFSFNKNSIDSLDLKVQANVGIQGKYEPLQYQWGVFNVTGSEIIIERWVTASGSGTYPTKILKGTIINDTTIHFHTLIGAHPVNYNSKKKVLDIDETYHFRQFSPKPDSTNTFIK